MKQGSYLTSKNTATIIFFLILLFNITSCSKGNNFAVTPKEALQTYLDCQEQGNIDCVYRLLPQTVKNSLKEASQSIKNVKKKIKNKNILTCLTKKAGISPVLLQNHAEKSILSFALSIKRKKMSNMIKGVRNAIKSIRKHRHNYRGITYAGTRYKIIKNSKGHFLVYPKNKNLRNINKTCASAMLLGLLAEKPNPCASKSDGPH